MWVMLTDIFMALVNGLFYKSFNTIIFMENIKKIVKKKISYFFFFSQKNL